jgi:hypothetical protein
VTFVYGSQLNRIPNSLLGCCKCRSSLQMKRLLVLRRVSACVYRLVYIGSAYIVLVYIGIAYIERECLYVYGVLVFIGSAYIERVLVYIGGACMYRECLYRESACMYMGCLYI